MQSWDPYQGMNHMILTTLMITGKLNDSCDHPEGSMHPTRSYTWDAPYETWERWEVKCPEGPKRNPDAFDSITTANILCPVFKWKVKL